MCGRFSLAVHSAEELLSFFGLGPVAPGEAPLDVVPRYNVAPSQQVPVARAGEAGPRLAMLHWGLIPPWSRGTLAEARKQSYRMINARAETVWERPAYARAIARLRVLVPTTGFYEWDRSGPKPHPATLFHLPDRGLYALGGIRERWQGPEGEVESFSLLTTAANALVGRIHDRMPVIVPREAWALWLDPATTARDAIEPLLGPANDGVLQATVVGSAVNDARSDTAACWQPG